MNEKPNPGSMDALRLGCQCPMVDNNYGQGVKGETNKDGSPVFWISSDCPVHTEEFYG